MEVARIGFGGGTGAVGAGLNPIIGLLVFTTGSGAAIGALGNRLRSRDVTIGIVLAWTLGLGVLFISLYRGYATEAYAILFGGILSITAGEVTVTVLAGLVTFAALIAMSRPLLFPSVDAHLPAPNPLPLTSLSIPSLPLLPLPLPS